MQQQEWFSLSIDERVKDINRFWAAVTEDKIELPSEEFRISWKKYHEDMFGQGLFDRYWLIIRKILTEGVLTPSGLGTHIHKQRFIDTVAWFGNYYDSNSSERFGKIMALLDQPWFVLNSSMDHAESVIVKNIKTHGSKWFFLIRPRSTKRTVHPDISIIMCPYVVAFGGEDRINQFAIMRVDGGGLTVNRKDFCYSFNDIMDAPQVLDKYIPIVEQSCHLIATYE
jgi:hypothetical protein